MSDEESRARTRRRSCKEDKENDTETDLEESSAERERACLWSYGPDWVVRNELQGGLVVAFEELANQRERKASLA